MLLITLAVLAVLIQDGSISTAPPPIDPVPAAAPEAGSQRPRNSLDLSTFAAQVEAQGREATAAANGGINFDVALDGSAAPPDGPVPFWAFSDPSRWERVQCGDTPEEACLRTARNRLAMARAEQAEFAPVERAASEPDRCRNVWTPSAEGVGGSFSRICGDAGASAQLLDDMRRRDDEARREAERDCVRRPETTDQGVRWTLVCGAATNRERANDALDSLLR